MTVNECSDRHLDCEQILPIRADVTDRVAWLAERRKGLGSSDVSALVGLSKWVSRYELYLDKIGELPDVDPGEAAEMGRLLEPVVRARFERVQGVTVEPVGMLRSRRWPWMLANPDGLCSDGAGYEGKTCSVWMAHEWADGQVADHAELQAQWGMAVTGLPAWWVAVLIGGQRNEYRRVERDDKLIDFLVAESGRFWDQVQNRIEPEPDHSPALTRILTERYQVAGPSEVNVSPDWRDEIARERAAAGKLMSEAKAADAAVKNRVRQLLGDAEQLVCGDEVLATWRNTGKFDERRFATDYPHLVDEYSAPVSEWVLDTARLAEAHPDIYRAYRGRRLLLKGAPDA